MQSMMGYRAAHGEVRPPPVGWALTVSVMATKLQKLLFVDTNIWLDFYRARNETGLALLQHVESVAAKVIVTYQLETEFKKNRQTAILEGMQELKAPGQIARLGIFSDAKASAVLTKSIKEAERRVKTLKAKLTKVLENPAAHDPVYKACQRIFHKNDALVLTREDSIRHVIRRKAFRRFLHGCPPRKKNDTSIGDAINWEWMIHCANEAKAELVIVTRDSDYGVIFENKAYVNDHLRQEFSERVSKKRKLLLYSRLSDALKHFEVPVSQQEEEAEAEILSKAATGVVVLPQPAHDPTRLFELIRSFESRNAVLLDTPPKSDA
jgi:predicted nucleic acid-binding protein